MYLVGGENKFGFSLFGANSASRFPTVDGISRSKSGLNVSIIMVGRQFVTGDNS